MDTLYKSIIEKSPFGFALFKINHTGRKINIKLIEYNSIFQKITNLKNLGFEINETTDFFDFTNNINFEFINYGIKLNALNNESYFEYYSDFTKCWYRVTVFLPEKDCFVVIFKDITEEKKEIERFKTLLLSSNDIVLEFDLNYKIIDILVTDEKKLYIPKEKSILKRVDELFDNELSAKFCNAFEKAAVSDEKFIVEYNLDMPFGSRWYEAVVFSKKDELGKKSLVAAIHDIHDKKLIEDELRESEERFKSLFQNMHEGVALHEIVYNRDREPIDYKILDVNFSYYKHTGIAQKIENGVLATQFYKCEIPPYLAQYEKVARTGIPYVFNTFYKPMNRYFNVSVFSPKAGFFATVFNDISDIVEVEKKLYSEKERLKTTLESIGDGVITTDNEGRIVLINRVAQVLTGWTQEEALNRPLHDVLNIIEAGTGNKCDYTINIVLEKGESLSFPNYSQLLCKNSEKYLISSSASPIKNENGEVFGAVLVFRDITMEKKREEEIVHLSFHDKLTGLYNRLFFEEELRRMDNQRQLPLSIIMGDVNGLKITNDVFGHKEGDNILIDIANILKKSCRSEDIISRWGGDEFVILLPNTDEIQANEVCKRIKRKCLEIKSNTVQLSISLGHATKRNTERSISDVLKQAEDWMYRHKLVESKNFKSSVLESLRKTLYEKTSETLEHSERVGNLCVKMGREIGLSESQLENLKILGTLHDIGNVVINQKILMKKEKLTGEEWEEIRKHPEVGYRIAQATPELSHLSDYILSHHEKWDGSGYPQNLRGSEIPLLSRIISITDSFDIMTHDQAYKKALSLDEAVREIKKCSGKHFDPVLVKILLNILKRSIKIQ